MRVKEDYPAAYHRGHKSRTDGKGNNPPHSLLNGTVNYHWWCAGWNDADIEIKNKKEMA